MSDPRLLDNKTLRATLKRIHAHAPDAWKDADLLRDHIEALERRLAKMCDLHMDEKRRRMAAEEQVPRTAPHLNDDDRRNAGDR